MIDDDHLDALLCDERQRVVVGGAAVAGDQQARAGAQDALHGNARHTVAAVKATRDERHCIAAQASQHLGEDGGGRDPVAVVVAEHGDALTCTNRLGQPAGHYAAVDHGVRRGEIRQPRLKETARPLHVDETASDQPTCHRLRETELLAQEVC
jgi:hypothetical protein